jgi:adenylate cyclase
MEFEYEIPIDDALKLLELCKRPIIAKTRYKIPYEGHSWEVDVFEGENEGLVMAEVELQSEDETVVLPEWIGKEVSGDKRYYNSYLSLHPYNEWK